MNNDTTYFNNDQKCYIDTMAHREEMSKLLKSRYKEYIENPLCIYKLCKDEWLIIMKKVAGENNKVITLTNEERENVFDASHAKFRADQLHVLVIVNIHTGDTKRSITNVYIDQNDIEHVTIYSVEHFVAPDVFNPNLNIVCSGGIHYHLTFEHIFNLGENLPIDQSGIVYTFHDNGQILSKGNYMNGKKNGYWINLYDDGKKQSEGNYMNDEKDGEWNYWYQNGKKCIQCSYSKGIQECSFTEWRYGDATKRIEQKYMQ
jgi:hypothetical protein